MILAATTVGDLAAGLRLACAMTDSEQVGILTQRRMSHYFAAEQKAAMRRCVEEAYDMPALKAYFEKYTESTRPLLSEHTSIRAWRVDRGKGLSPCAIVRFLPQNQVLYGVDRLGCHREVREPISCSFADFRRGEVSNAFELHPKRGMRHVDGQFPTDDAQPQG